MWWDIDAQQWGTRDLDSHYHPRIAEVIIERIEAEVAALASRDGTLR